MDILAAPLSRFVASLGRKSRFADDFRYGTKLRGTQKALEYKNISLNQKLRRYIVLDVDRQDAGLAWREIDLAPTITCINLENGHGHLMYELIEPVPFSEKSRSKPQDYFKAVERGLTTALGADRSYSGLMTKNPLSDHWLVDYNNGRFSLEELSEYCDISESDSGIKTQVTQGLGRNCDLFNIVRMWAYFQVRMFYSYDAWYNAVLDKCINENNFMPKLPYSEVKCMAKSVASWTWKNQSNFGNVKNRGAAHVDQRLKLSNKQKAGANYTNQLRKEKTEKIITQAVRELEGKGTKITVAKLIDVSGVSQRTIYNYDRLWKGR